MKLRRKSKTFWFGIILLCLGVVEANASVFGEYKGFVLMASGIISIILREFTREPLAPLTNAQAKR